MQTDPTTLGNALRETEAQGRLVFSAITRQAREASRETEGLSRTLSTSLSRSLRAATLDGRKLSDVLRGLALDISRRVASKALNAVIAPLGNAIGTQLGGVLGFAKGGMIDAGRVRAFAKGGVLSSPTTFPMPGGIGLAGEAGPEAILPLRRGADGRLGVAAQGQAAPTVIVNISTPDIEGFRRSQTQIAATLARAVGRGQRNL